MTEQETEECRSTVLDTIKTLRKYHPELSFDIKAPEFGRDNYHLEVIASKKHKTAYGARVKKYRDIFIRKKVNKVVAQRVLQLAVELGIKDTGKIYMEFVNGLA